MPFYNPRPRWLPELTLSVMEHVVVGLQDKPGQWEQNPRAEGPPHVRGDRACGHRPCGLALSQMWQVAPCGAPPSTGANCLQSPGHSLGTRLCGRFHTRVAVRGKTRIRGSFEVETVRLLSSGIAKYKWRDKQTAVKFQSVI